MGIFESLNISLPYHAVKNIAAIKLILLNQSGFRMNFFYTSTDMKNFFDFSLSLKCLEAKADFESSGANEM